MSEQAGDSNFDLAAAEGACAYWQDRAMAAERELSKVEGRAVEWSIKAQQWQARAERAERACGEIEVDE